METLALVKSMKQELLTDVLCVLKWGTTSNKEVYDINTLDRLTEYWNNGTISFRYPRSTRRIGVKTINKHCVKNVVTLQHFCPF